MNPDPDPVLCLLLFAEMRLQKTLQSVEREGSRKEREILTSKRQRVCNCRGAAFRSGRASAASCCKVGLWSVTEGEDKCPWAHTSCWGKNPAGLLKTPQNITPESPKRPIAHCDRALKRRAPHQTLGWDKNGGIYPGCLGPYKLCLFFCCFFFFQMEESKIQMV